MNRCGYNGEEAFENFRREFVYRVESRKELVQKIIRMKGKDYLEKLKLKDTVFSEPIRMGL